MLIALWLAGCIGTTSIATRNTPPEAVWLSPDPGDALAEGHRVLLRVAVSDADGDADAAVPSWFVNDAPVCVAAEVVDGETACDAVVPSGVADVRVEVRDEGGAAAVLRQRFSVVPNAPPTIAWRLPGPDQASWGDVPVALEVAVDDVEDGAAGLVVAWTSDRLGPLGASEARAEDGVARLSVPLDEGWHDITAVVTDSVGGASAVSSTVRVRAPNASPTCGWTGPSEGDAWEVGAPQRLDAYADDAEDHGPDLWGRWTSDRDGVLAEGALDAAGTLTGVAVPVTPGVHVVTWQVEDADGAVCLARRIFDVGTPPSLGALVPGEGAVVLAGASAPASVVVSDAEVDAGALVVRWTSNRDGLLGTATPGTDGVAAVILPGLSPGWHVLTATVTDPTGLASQRAVQVFANQPPSAPRFDEPPSQQVTTEVSLSPRVGDVGVDPEGAPVTLLWSWSLDGIEVATDISYVEASLTESGQRWLVRIIATDGFHQSAPVSMVIDVINHVPSLDDVNADPLQVRVGDAVVCSAALRDLDLDGWVEFNWYVGDTWVAEGPFYPVGSSGEAHGAPLRCEAMAVDAAGTTPPLVAGVEVVNTAPRVLGVTLSAGAPRAGDTLHCAFLGVDDADGDVVDVTLRWTVNGATSGYGPTFDGNFRAGDVVGCSASGFDGYEVGDEAGASVVVANAAPQIYDVAVTPEAPAVGEAVTCSYRVVDRDREDPAVFVTWSRDGVPLSQGVRYVVTDRDPPGATLHCEVVAVDPAGATGVGGADAVVRNTPPYLTSVTITPQAPRSDSLLVAVANGGDVNRQALFWRYVWSVDGVVVADGPGSTLIGLQGAFARGDLVRVWVEVSDGSLSTSATSMDVSIGNALPGAPEVGIEPADPVAGEALTCVVRSPAVDPDGDALTYVVAWTRDGAAWSPSGSADDEVAAGTVAAGEVWACSVQADDGEGFGPPGTDAVSVAAP